MALPPSVSVVAWRAIFELIKRSAERLYGLLVALSAETLLDLASEHFAAFRFSFGTKVSENRILATFLGDPLSRESIFPARDFPYIS